MKKSAARKRSERRDILAEPGQSAAAKEFDATAVRLAVVAHIRHKHTDYDQFLSRYDDKQLARREVQGKIEAILDEWEQPGLTLEKTLNSNEQEECEEKETAHLCDD